MIRLLIADDERMEREALADIVMRRFEHEVTVEMAENGRKAADTAVLWEADLILMDIEMPGMNGMVEGLGANPTVVAFGELYSALQTGVVDGAEQPIANYKSNAFPEVANNLILDGHTLGAVQAVITDNAWGKLTANQQAAVMAAAADTQKFNADLSETAENKVLEELRSSGCNVVDVDDKTPWQEACAKVIKDNTSDQAELYQKLLDMKA